MSLMAQKAGSFASVPRGIDTKHHLAKGYSSQTLMRWGDAILSDAPTFDPLAQSAAAQEKQFGFNNDFIAYFPINGSSSHGLLCINHEYPNARSMFTGDRTGTALSDEEQRVQMASVGCSIMELTHDASGWRHATSNRSRRITATTPMQLTGPAAGHARLRTSADPDGQTVLGTFANCAGGQTPWATYLTCEENFDDYFLLGNYDGPERENHKNLGIGNRPYQRWDAVDKRFFAEAEPNEPNRFGWVVEIDPFDPQSTPKKRTALGRFKHESATPILNADGHVVIYSGDDEVFQHLYKFVSAKPYIKGEATEHLLDDGTLYAARFDADGSTHWLPLIFGDGPLSAENGFTSQADILIDARKAAKLLGATPMDRPEDVEIHPETGAIFVAMTKNPMRLRTDAVNRKRFNTTGYILQIVPPEGDHTATQARWELVLEGSKDTLACPDNLAFDARGDLWVATDGQERAIGTADGFYRLRGEQTECLFRAPIGAEVCGPCFTPDNKTLFLAVQHPGEGSSFDDPSTRWPDFDETMPPRPAILAIQKDDGGVIGS